MTKVVQVQEVAPLPRPVEGICLVLGCALLWGGAIIIGPTTAPGQLFGGLMAMIAGGCLLIVAFASIARRK